VVVDCPTGLSRFRWPDGLRLISTARRFSADFDGTTVSADFEGPTGLSRFRRPDGFQPTFTVSPRKQRLRIRSSLLLSIIFRSTTHCNSYKSLSKVGSWPYPKMIDWAWKTWREQAFSFFVGKKCWVLKCSPRILDPGACCRIFSLVLPFYEPVVSDLDP
jgi:hypothetical protein